MRGRNDLVSLVLLSPTSFDCIAPVICSSVMDFVGYEYQKEHSKPFDEEVDEEIPDEDLDEIAPESNSSG